MGTCCNQQRQKKLTWGISHDLKRVFAELPERILL